MSKRFSIVNIDDTAIFLIGWVEPKELSNSIVFVNKLSEYSIYDTVSISIYHNLITDTPDKDTDISKEELIKIIEVYEELVTDGYVYIEEILDFTMQGIKEEEIIEETYK